MDTLEHISWDAIHNIWKNRLWPERQSEITPNSAMVFLGGHDRDNMDYQPTFWGRVRNGMIIGVNSGHRCSDGSYRSRGLWVAPEYRCNGLGKILLNAVISQAQTEGATYCWSVPRRQSWPAYASVGFRLSSDWFPTETSDFNAFCRIDLR